MIISYDNIYPKIGKNVFISENASIIGDVRLGEDVSIWFGVVLRGDIDFIEIGSKSNIQDLSVCHVCKGIPLIIGKEVTVGHGAKLHGCVVKDRCLIGIGSIILDNSVIGEGSLIAAGSLVTPNTIIPPRSLVMGIPAKIKRKVTNKEYKEIINNSINYIEYKNKFIKFSV